MVADSARIFAAASCVDAPSFLEVYDTYVDFVWRTARRLGVSDASIDDVVQETFLVVHRRLEDASAAAMRSWVYGITVRVVRNHRRARARRSPHEAQGAWADPDLIADGESKGPFDLASRAEAAQLLHHLLGKLDDDKREAFVLVELEQLTVPEAAVALATNPNTLASRLRLAREEFEAAAHRLRVKDEWRLR